MVIVTQQNKTKQNKIKNNNDYDNKSGNLIN